MSGINTEHKIYLKVLTPLHIGGAQEKNLQENLDYIQHRGTTWKLNWEKIYDTFSAEDIANAIINNKLKRLVENELEDIADEIDQTFGDTREIKTFIRDGLGKSYIPGSSIKGALKSWTHAALEKKFNLKETRDLLGRFDSDVFRFIEPSDCFMKEEVELFPTKTFNLQGQGRSWEGGWKHALRNNTTVDFSDTGFVTDYECFSPGTIGQFTLKTRKKLTTKSEELLFSRNDNTKKSYEVVLKNNALKNLFDLVSSQTKKHVERELNFFNQFNQAEYTEDIIRTYQSLLDLSKQANNNQCLLRLSTGSGFHGITGDFQFDNHTQTGIWSQNDARKYKLSRKQSEQYVDKYMKFKSRKIAFTNNEMYPMGFALLSTEPFEKNASKLSAKTVQTIQSTPNNQVSTKIVVQSEEGKEKDASHVRKGDIVFGVITKIGKPFCSVRLLLTNYNFTDEASLSGVKKFKIEVGQVVKCQLGDPSTEAEFKQVRFVP